MTIKNAKFEEELTFRFKVDMNNLTDSDPSTQTLKNFHFNGFLLNKVYNVWAKHVQRSLITLKIDAKFEGKLTCIFQNNMRNMVDFHQSNWKILKLGLWWDPFIRSTKCMSLQFTEELSVITMKYDAKFEEELTCRSKVRWGIWWISTRALKKVSKTCTLMGSFWTKYIMFELKNYRGVMFDGTEDWCKFWRKIHKLKNSDFILESKMVKLNQNKNSKQLDRPDAVRILYFTLEINE